MLFKRFVLLFLMVAGAIGVTTLFSPPAQAVSYDCTAQTSISVIECEALVAIYEANPEATFDPSWLYPWFSPCDWRGVECYECEEWNPVCEVVGLHLSGLNLTLLPPEIGNLRNLQADNNFSLDFRGNLNLSDNNLQVLPPELGQLDKLSALSLNNNQLKEWPTDMDPMSSLGVLSLSGNQFEELPTTLISSLPWLRYLDLSNNKLQSLPPEIGQLRNLSSLDLAQNQLTTISDEIGQLEKLRRLDLAQNQLTTIPDEIGLLQRLSYFYIEDNPLDGPMPEAVLDLPLPLSSGGGIKIMTYASQFFFFDTNWCIPDDSAYHEWFEQQEINLVLGTGFVCGMEPALLTGRITDERGESFSQATVKLYRHDKYFSYPYGYPQVPFEPYWSNRWTFLEARETDEHGRYQFENLGQEIDYLLYFESPSPAYQSHYYFHQKQMTKADFINLPLASVTNIDAVLRPYYRAHLPLVMTH